MALSDVFHHEGHTGMTMAGVQVGGEDGFFSCEYADLLATQTLGSEPAHVCSDIPTLPVEMDDIEQDEHLVAAILASANLVRGPPYSQS